MVERAIVLDLFHDSHLGPVNFDVARRLAMRGISGVCAADIGDLEHHVRLSLTLLLAVPKAYTHILHAVSC